MILLLVGDFAASGMNSEGMNKGSGQIVNRSLDWNKTFV